MASKVLVPTAPFTKLQVKKTPTEPAGSGFIIGGGDATARVAHLEHSVRFLQEQHRLMLNGLHAEIEALRERNRDLQFQLIFNKESTSKACAAAEDQLENNEEKLRKEVCRLEKEATTARGEARAAEERALELQVLVDAQAEKLRELEIRQRETCAGVSAEGAEGGDGAEGAEGRAELRARLAEAERLVRRLRADAERQRREVLGGAGVTNLLFDGAAAQHAHLQCMKNSLHASLRASGLDTYGYQNYHFPMHPPDFWRDPLREEYSMGSRGRHNRRPLTLPELNAVNQPLRATVYANNHARGRGHSYDKNKKGQTSNGDSVNGKSPEEQSEEAQLKSKLVDNLTNHRTNSDHLKTYPELKIVVTKIIPHGNVNSPGGAESRPRARRPHHHRKHAADHT